MLPSGSGAVQNTDRICSVVAHVQTEFIQDCEFELRIVLCSAYKSHGSTIVALAVAAYTAEWRVSRVIAGPLRR
jgi:hypothetical protein